MKAFPSRSVRSMQTLRGLYAIHLMEKARQAGRAGRQVRIQELEKAVDEYQSRLHESQSAIKGFRSAMRSVKLTALTAKNAVSGLAHIIRICIDAGITERLDDLRKLTDENAELSSSSQVKEAN